jgi:hypothetical protein
MRTSRLVALLPAVLGVLSACGGIDPCVTCTGGGAGGGSATTDGGADGGSSSSVTDALAFCTELINAQVDYRIRCGSLTAAGGFERQQGTAAYCAGFVSSLPGLKDGRLRIDPAQRATCMSAVAALLCTGSFQAIAECDGALQGTVVAGGDCFSTQECATGNWCNLGTCPGKCTAQLATGQSAPVDERCLSGWSNNGTCAAPIAIGQSCANGLRCVNRAVCENTTFKCQADVGIGINQPCATTSTRCGEGLQCVNDVCISLVGVNGACDGVRHCKQDLDCASVGQCVAPGGVAHACNSPFQCKSGLFCNAPAGQQNGSCSMRRTIGESCDFSVDSCEAALWCTAGSNSSGVCATRGATGAPCDSVHSFDACQTGLYCTATLTAMSGQCQQLKAAGTACTDSSECNGSCVSHLCVSVCTDPTP